MKAKLYCHWFKYKSETQPSVIIANSMETEELSWTKSLHNDMLSREEESLVSDYQYLGTTVITELQID